MKKSNFVALIMGTVSVVLFALGMCMTLLTEWNAFKEGIVSGCAGIVLGIITVLLYFRMEGKKFPKITLRNLLRILYTVTACLILGTGMCICMVWNKIVWGVLVGLIGIVMLIGLIPMFKGIK